MKYFAILCLSLLLSACGEFAGQTNQENTSCFENCSNQNNSQNDKVVDLNAEISGGVHDGSQAIKTDLNTQTLTLSLPITGGSYINSSNEGYSITEISGATLSVVEPNMGTTRLDLNIPLAQLIRNHSLSQSDTLPNGESIPTFKSGDHGYVDIDLNDINIRIYISRGHLAIYLESPFDPYVQVSYPSINKDDIVLGYFTQIPAIAHSQGAFFSSMVLSESALMNIDNLQ